MGEDTTGDQKRSRPSDRRRHGFGSPEGMEMKDFPTAAAPRPVSAALSAGRPDRQQQQQQQQQQQRRQPYPVPISITASASSQSPPRMDILESTTAPSNERTSPSMPATESLLQAEKLIASSPSHQLSARAEETPTKPRKRRLFFSKSPTKSTGQRQQAFTRSPVDQSTPQQEVTLTPSYSHSITSRTPSQYHFQTPGSATSSKTPKRRPDSAIAGTQSSGRRQRRTPVARTGLSGLSSTTPRSASRRTPSGRKFNPLGKISDIFSPQSPISFSSSSSRATGRSPGDSFGLTGAGDGSLVSVDSSDAGSVSTTNSVKEPFAEQVERLDQLLATPSQQLGELAYTPHEEYRSDDDLDNEMEDLESSRRLLAEELSRVNLSLLGGGGGDDDDSHGNDWIEGTSAKEADNSDWMSLLRMAEDYHPPNFSPIEQLQTKKGSAASTATKTSGPKKPDKPSLPSSGNSSKRSFSISKDVTIYSSDKYSSPSTNSANVADLSQIYSGYEYFSPSMKSINDGPGKTETISTSRVEGELEVDRKPAAKDPVKPKATRMTTPKNINYKSFITPPRERGLPGETQNIVEKKTAKKERMWEKNKHTPSYAKLQEEDTTTTASANIQTGNSRTTRRDTVRKVLQFVPSTEEAEDSAPRRLMLNPTNFAQDEKEKDRMRNFREWEAKSPTAEEVVAMKEIQFVMDDPGDSSSGEAESTTSGKIEEYAAKSTTTLKARPGRLNVQEKGTLAAPSPTHFTQIRGEYQKEEDRRKKTSHSLADQKVNLADSLLVREEVDPEDLTPQKKHTDERAKEVLSEKSSSDSSSTFDPFGFVASGESQSSSVDIGYRESSTGSPTSSPTSSTNKESILLSFLSFAERFDGGGTSKGRNQSASTPKRDLEHSRRILEHLNSIFTPSGKGDPNLPTVLPDRHGLLPTTVTDFDEAAKKSPSEKKAGVEEILFSTPSRDQELSDESICGLSPISQDLEQVHLSRIGRDREDLISLLESSPGNEHLREEASMALLSTKRASSKIKVASDKRRRSKYKKTPKLNDSSTMDPVLPDDGDDNIFFDPDSPHAAEPYDVITLLPENKDNDEFDKSKMPKRYGKKDKKDPTPVKGTKSRCKKLFLVIASLVFIIGCVALVMGTIFYSSAESGSANLPSPTIRPTQETTSAPMMISSPPSTIHLAPSLRPTNPYMSSNLNPPSDILENSSLSPTHEGSESPTLTNIISFNIPYNVYIANGRVNFAPQSEYIPGLIASMNFLTDDILLNIVKRMRYEGRRRLTEVVLPTTITDAVDISCPVDTNKNSLCQEVTAKISLMDAKNSWQQFKATTELAIEIGRLQYYLQRVDPDSPAEVMDAVWSPPLPALYLPLLPTTIPSSMPTSYSLLDFLVENSFDSGEALNDTLSPQHKAYIWLRKNYFLAEYSEQQRLQRYAMATLYYATNGDQWLLNDLWLSDRSECTWFGKTGARRQCNKEGGMVHLELDLNNLGGSLPAELGLLSSTLNTITLQGGPSSYLQGTLPAEFGYLTHLEILGLRNNDLSGTIPSEIGTCRSLREIDLSRSGFEGQLPSEIGNFAELTLFDISLNYLSGNLPTELGRLEKCRKMFFESNDFVSSIPTQIGYLQELEALRGGGNELHSLPTELGELKSADIISFRGSSIAGTIPTELGRLRALRKFYEI